MRNFVVKAALAGGLIAGTIDIFAAALINWLNPIVILHAIASGVLGKASFYAGARTTILGLLLQWAMSILIAAIYALAATRISLLTRRWIASGLSYGVVIFIVMNFVVVPLSAAWPKHHGLPPADKIIENLLAMFLFGLIVAFTASRSSVSRA